MSSTAIGTLGHPHPAERFIRSPFYVNASDLGASSAVTITQPAGGRYLRLRGNLDFYYCAGSTGVSTGTATNGSGSALVPLQSGGVELDLASTAATTAFSVMSTAACHLTQEWWAA